MTAMRPSPLTPPLLRPADIAPITAISHSQPERCGTQRARARVRPTFLAHASHGRCPVTSSDPEWQARWPMNVQCLPWFPRNVVCELNVTKFIEEMFERYTSLQSRQCGTETEVDTVAKRDVRIWLARDVEVVRVGHVLRVP